MSNVPKLRFKEFSGKWEKKTVGDIGKVSMCKRILKDQTTSDGDIPFYKIGTFGKEPDAFISKVIFEEFKAKYSFPKEGEILISASGTIGRTVIYDGSPSYFQDSNIVWIANNEKLALNKFLLYCYENTRWNTENTTIARLYNENLRNIPLILPSKQEQDKIASFLTSVDTKIEQLSRKEELLQQYKKGVMQKIFSQEIRFKADDGSEFCEWEEKKLGDICKLQGGFAFKSEQFRKSGIPIIRISNISNINNYIDRENIVYYDAIPNDRNFSITNGDLIVAMSGATTGKASIYNLNEKAYLNQRVGLFRANKDKLYYGYLVQFVFSKLFYRQLDTVLVAGAQPNISSKDIEDFKFNLPCLKEQIKIANFLSSIDSKIEQVQQHLNSTKEFKKALLQQMFV